MFGIDYVADCAEGLVCACVDSCADPMIMDAPTTCVLIDHNEGIISLLLIRKLIIKVSQKKNTFTISKENIFIKYLMGHTTPQKKFIFGRSGALDENDFGYVSGPVMNFFQPS